ncbi:hypothetical protein ACHWQZ_G001699 [Mnemiopsis leidyi]
MPVVTVLYFARCREITGKVQEKVLLPETVSLDNILTELAKVHPALETLRGKLTVAHNQAYLEGSVQLQSTDEIALIPPVSGG